MSGIPQVSSENGSAILTADETQELNTAITDFCTNKWEELKKYTVENSLRILIYTLAMKVFGFYCRNFFNPLGQYLFFIIVPVSLIFDIAIITTRKDFIPALSKSYKIAQDQILTALNKTTYEPVKQAVTNAVNSLTAPIYQFSNGLYNGAQQFMNYFNNAGTT